MDTPLPLTPRHSLGGGLGLGSTSPIILFRFIDCHEVYNCPNFFISVLNISLSGEGLYGVSSR